MTPWTIQSMEFSRSRLQETMGLCSPWGCKELDMTEQLSLSLFTFNQQGPTAQHMELCSMLCGSLDVRGFGREWIHVYLWLSPFTAHLRLTQLLIGYQFSSVHSVVSDSLRPHELQHARPPCPSPTPRVYSNTCPSSQ